MSQLKLNLLVLDDDELILESLRSVTHEPWNFIGMTSFSAPKEPIHAALVDLHLSEDYVKCEGLQVIKALSQQHPHAEIVAISGDLSRDLMEKTLKAGASRFLPKPLTPDEVILTLNKLESYFQMMWAKQDLVTPWVGSSKTSNELRRQISLLKGELSPVLIEGESGTGKEVVARLLHEQEPSRPFISINVAALPENLFEAEFFGYVKGAFTGANQSKMGLAEAANGGDLFLDEVEALPISLQAKLLRFLESGELRRIGSNESIIVQTRIIAATNENLNKMVSANKFREDLSWRLSGHKLAIPPLRERLEDLEELFNYFVKNIRPVKNKQLSEDAIQALKQYDWPGNVRELKRLCEQVCLLSPLPIIRDVDIVPLIRPSAKDTNTHNLDLQLGLPKLMNHFEKRILETAIKSNRDVDALAKTLQISRSSLYKKLKDYELSL